MYGRIERERGSRNFASRAGLYCVVMIDLLGGTVLKKHETCGAEVAAEDAPSDAVRPARQRKSRRAALMSWRACLGCAVTALVWLGGLPLSASAEWTPPVQVSATGGNVQIAEDGRSDAFAVWQECRSGCNEQVVVADYLPAGASSWQPPVQISTGEEGCFAQIAGDFSGDGLAVWGSHAGPQSAVRPASLGAWRTPTPIGPPSGDPYEPPRMAVDPAGDAVAVWQQENFTIEAAFRPAATGEWEAPVVVSGSGEHASEPQVAIREGGEVAAVWSVYEPETVPCPSPPSSAPCALIIRDKDSLKAAFRPVRATWQAPVILASAQSAGEPRISLDGAGNATALWSANVAGNRTIESSLRPAGGGWLTPVTISSTPLPHLANELDSSLQLAVDAQGEATAAWVHKYTSATGGISGVAAVETAVRGVHGSWQAPSVIPGSEPNVGSLRLAENASGTAAAVWSCQVGDHYPVTARGSIRPTADGEWRHAVDISAAEGGGPGVALGPDGKAVAIWDEGGPFTPGAPPAGIYFSAYEAGLIAPGAPQSAPCTTSSSPAAHAPVLSRVRVTHTRFRVGRTPTATTAKTAKTVSGTAFLFHLSATAGVSVALSTLTTGLKRGRLCLAPSRMLRRAHARSCQRTVGVAKLTRRSEPVGEDRISFSGRIGRRPLRPGNYTARLVASDAAGSSAPAAVRFEIVR